MQPKTVTAHTEYRLVIARGKATFPFLYLYGEAHGLPYLQ